MPEFNEVTVVPFPVQVADLGSEEPTTSGVVMVLHTSSHEVLVTETEVGWRLEYRKAPPLRPGAA